jgi:hypothetical protein
MQPAVPTAQISRHSGPGATNERVAELPDNAETVAAFLAFEASRAIRPATIARRVAAIRYAHTLAGHEPPTNAETVRATLRGIRRTMGTASIREAPITAELVRAMARQRPIRWEGCETARCSCWALPVRYVAPNSSP